MRTEEQTKLAFNFILDKYLPEIERDLMDMASLMGYYVIDKRQLNSDVRNEFYLFNKRLLDKIMHYNKVNGNYLVKKFIPMVVLTAIDELNSEHTSKIIVNGIKKEPSLLSYLILKFSKDLRLNLLTESNTSGKDYCSLLSKLVNEELNE